MASLVLILLQTVFLYEVDGGLYFYHLFYFINKGDGIVNKKYTYEEIWYWDFDNIEEILGNFITEEFNEY